MADRLSEAAAKAIAFQRLIRETIAALRGAAAPASLSAAIEACVTSWDKADPEFATLLREVRGQAWSMEPAHLRAVTAKVCEHLEVNLQRIEKELRSMTK